MRNIDSETRVVENMISLYCQKNHGVEVMCKECEEMKNYAQDRLTQCPFGENEMACNVCHVHCYKASMRTAIRAIMRFSGPRMLFYYPKDFFRHLIKNITLKYITSK